MAMPFTAATDVVPDKMAPLEPVPDVIDIMTETAEEVTVFPPAS